MGGPGSAVEQRGWSIDASDIIAMMLTNDASRPTFFSFAAPSVIELADRHPEATA